MVEIGTSGWPWRASGIAIGTALAAEADGAHVVWFADRIPLPVSPDDWAADAGPLLPLVPDPADVADPVVTAAAALLVTRHARVGILGWAPGADPGRAARTLASLADLAPDRAVVALAGDGRDAAARSRPRCGRRRSSSPSTAAPADGRGRARLGMDRRRRRRPTSSPRPRVTPGSPARSACTCPVVVHADAGGRTPGARRRRCSRRSPTRCPPTAWSSAIPSGSARVIDEYVAHGVDRIVLDDLLAFGAPGPARGGPGRGPGRDPQRAAASPSARRRRRGAGAGR